MDKQTAAKVMSGLIEASSKLATTIEDVRSELQADEFKRYAKYLGEILGSIQLDLMAPIIREHPDLDPGHEPT